MEHVRQLADWDCGLACVEMVMRWIYRHLQEPLPRDIRKRIQSVIQSESIWTVDLATYLVDEFDTTSSVDVWFASNVMHVNPVHQAHPFYHAEFAADVARVGPKYTAWQARGAVPRHVPCSELMQRMKDRPSALIVLVDASRLTCCVWGQRARQTGFQGHFIVVVDIVQEDGNVVVHYVDSASDQHTRCRMDGHTFDVARCSPDTDEDLILVSVSR
ncbi:unnamed protein product [Aphanomyces euteiches]|uniref:Peptidase C39 domain-containing protein n=1 Tax=Aphanomyces euteiches TaxID=100861 RepID=A0A6G0WD08_9STRA|nr:hypothetical protein Ae201684_017048 [Aphanomyces euteiches]KAH9078520.1 hypothetical protein Ae201684P_019603 [Aphanomyces euteiches]KAH9143796.1 hypothetical protein AeRB84_012224 [Aphanomyces euteiches]